MPNLQMPELLLLLLVVVLLFGAKKLPDTARGLGRSLRIFKAETKGMHDDEKSEDSSQPSTSQPETNAEPRQITAAESAPPPPPATPATPAAERERD